MTKSIGIGLLAMATTASMAVANGGEDEKKTPNGDPTLYQSQPVSFKPGSGITFDGGDEFKLQLRSQLQVQWRFSARENMPDLNTFRVRRARIAMRGHVFNKDIMYKLQIDAADVGPPVKDAWIHWRFLNSEDGNAMAMRAGQSKTFFGLEATGTSAGLDFVERSLATQAFTDLRSQGAWIFGSHVENKLRWNLGAQNGDVAGDSVFNIGEEFLNNDNELSYVANVSFDPMGDYMSGAQIEKGTGRDNESFRQGDLEHTEEVLGTIGGGVFFGNGRDPGNTFDIETTSFNLNTAWKVKGWGFLGEYFWREDSPDVPGGMDEAANGWYLQGSYTLPKSGDSDLQWGFPVRIAMIDTDDFNNFLPGSPLGAAAGEVFDFQLGVNAFYHGHAAKTQITYTFRSIDFDAVGASDSDNHIIAAQFTLLF